MQIVRDGVRFRKQQNRTLCAELWGKHCRALLTKRASHPQEHSAWTLGRQPRIHLFIPYAATQGAPEMMLKLKLQYFGHLMWRVDLLEKTLMLGGIRGRGEGDDRGWDIWMASLTQWTWVWVNSGCWWWTGRPGVLQFMGSQRVGQDCDWTELNWTESDQDSTDARKTFTSPLTA